MAQPKLDENTIYLIDGSGYIFRAYFAIRKLRSKSGVPTNAVYGFTTMLLKLLKEHNPRYVGIAFDRKEPTFRHEIYRGYKANRPQPPDDLIPQFDLINQVVSAFNIKLLSKSGFEADDLLATMTKRARDAGREVVVVTGDKDLMQLVDENTFLLDELRAARNGAEQFIDREQVRAELGVWPHEVVDLLALAGDTSDNVPGVAGIGKKTAAELINEFGPIEKILSMIPLIKQKSRQDKLMEGRELAMLSKKLVSIDHDVDIDCSIEQLHYNGVNKEALRDLFLQLDFNRLLKEQALFGDERTSHDNSSRQASSEFAKGAYDIVTNQRSLDELVEKLLGSDKIALNVETDSSNAMMANIIGLTFAWSTGLAAYVPIAHDREIFPEQLSLSTVINAIAAIFAKKKIVAHNAKFVHEVLARHVGEFAIGGDPMLANYLLHQDQEKHGLADLSVKYLHHELTSDELIYGTKKSPTTMAKAPKELAKNYAAEKVDITLRLEQLLENDLETSALTKLYSDLELPLEEVLSRMERVGVKIDTDVLSEVGQNLKVRLQELESTARDLAGAPFNLGSPKQVAEILYDKLGLPAAKKTKTGFSTDSSVLEKLAPSHALPKILLEHRMCAKLINTYIETLPLLINKTTGRLHTSYNQFVTATGRLSSSDPNLQNIPVRTKEGRKIREAFVVREGYRLISLDYSQVELRLLALVTKDPVMVDSFAKDQDVHVRTASEIFEVAPEQVTKEQRAAAKTINFGILYGMGSLRLSQTLNIPRKQAQNYLDIYFEKYAGIFRWKADCLKAAHESFEVRTLFGRKRNLVELKSKSGMDRARGERIAINTPIQGTAADIIKKAMIDTDAYLTRTFPNAHLIMQVHDELVIEAPAEHAETIARDVAQIMARGHGLDVDLKVEYGIADNWNDAH